MIIERKKRMTYTYFHRDPKSHWCTTHLFSPVQTSLRGMVRIPFPTMVIDLRDPDFLQTWSASTRQKIRRAQQDFLAVDRGRYLISGILTFFDAIAERKGLRGYSPEDLESFTSLECSAIHSDGVMLCSHIWVLDIEEKRALLYVNASQAHEDPVVHTQTGRLHYFLLWQDAVYLRQLGMETLDLMGYERETSDRRLKGVYQWKAATHGATETLYHYYPWWFYLLRKLRNMVTR